MNSNKESETFEEKKQFSKSDQRRHLGNKSRRREKSQFRTGERVQLKYKSSNMACEILLCSEISIRTPYYYKFAYSAPIIEKCGIASRFKYYI